jgi:site-specific recombinase XerD
VALLERQGHLQLTKEEHSQVLAMSLSTAERFLRAQSKPRVHGLSTTTPGPRCKSQIPVRTFSQWKEDRPGFVEMDLVAHCGEHLDGSFLYTMTLTDLATGWTECIPLLDKSANAVLAALAQARTLFPFPLLGIDTDSGSEFLNEELLAYCEQEQLTFTRGRPAVKNDQCHVEQKNGAVVRKSVGYERLVGVQAYHQLREVYRALRLVVNCFQPSLKLQANVHQGNRVRRVYDVAQTPLQRLLASGVLPEDRQRALREWVHQIDPLALSEQLDALRHASLCGAHLPLAIVADGPTWPQLSFSLADCTSASLPTCEEGPERAGPSPMETLMHDLGPICPPLQASWEEPWSPECNQRGHLEPLIIEPDLPEDAVSAADQYVVQVQSLPTPAPGTSSSTAGEHKAGHLALTTVDLHIVPSARTGATRTVNTVAAYARSVRAFCNWLVRQGYVSETLFPKGAVPKAQRGLPQAVEPEEFVHLLRACQLPGEPGGQNAGMTARNRAILWLLLDTGLQVSELCGLRLADVDRAGGTVTVRGKRGRPRTFPLSADGQRAVCAYLDQARLTPAWEPSVPAARDRLLLTDRRHPLTKNSLTLLFKRLSQRAGFTRTPICPSMLRDTYAIRFVQAGGGLAALQEQLGVAGLASVRRYQRFCDEQESSEESLFTRHSRRGKSKHHQERGRGRVRRPSS